MQYICVALLHIFAGSVITGCQSQDGDGRLSQWMVADWVMRNALQSDGPPLEQLQPYLSDRALIEIDTFKQALQPDQAVGVLTLNHQQGQRWKGRYAFLKNNWPMALNIDMTYTRGFWQIDRFPFIEIYTQLAKLTQATGVPQVQNGEIWHGGLISYDLSGRPQAEVVLTWLPPFVFIDGVPLQGKTTAQKVLQAIEHAFMLRAEMADHAQADYMKRLILCMPSQGSFKELMQLIQWGESVGSDVISLLARNAQSEAVLIRLAKRVPRVTLLKTQSIAHSHLNAKSLTLVSPPNSSQKVADQTWSIADQVRLINTGKFDHKLLTDAQEADAFKSLSKMKVQDTLHGLQITASSDQSYGAVITWIDQLKTLDPKLEITLSKAPLKR